MSADILERACNSTAAVLDLARGADLDQPTPCLSWNVRDVINHVIGSAATFARIAETGSYPAGDTEHDCTAGDFSAAFRRQAQRVVAAFSAPDAMSKGMQLPFGEVPGAICVWIAAADIFTHGWDLAKALGQSTDLDPGLAGQLLARLQSLLPDAMRGPDGEAAFGPIVEVADSAPAADRLAAFEGRHP
ncbi:MAG TPA: TIGR03086 family metal-binding protein [Streptosporangiaceae bacterium]|nr:TIGR03086 family metal-binding protein [Streptosporangiaceae bacterium]